ncbi:MAG TPA: Mur ligase family protein [Ktedonobacterales bacterium]|nr:Mur ligase family protein [Ktedonobacterales bacterium]
MEATMTYQQALAWLYSLSDTERTGAFRRDREDNMARERALLAQLGDPQRAYGITHIAGTKGKGSTCAILAAILKAAGIRTGFYSSPDLHTFRERIRLAGHVISEAEVARLTPQIQAALARVGTSLDGYITFEAATALAFLAFREAGVAHAVVEVGLGGRLDATNVVEPLVSVITSISYEHMNVLGHTLTEIAGEKAGIIKPGVPVITSAQAPEAVAAITRIANERGAPLTRIGPASAPDTMAFAYTYTPGPASEDGQRLDVTTPTGVYRDLELRLLGLGQLENATAAIAAAEQLRGKGLPIDETAIRQGLREVSWPARLQLVGRSPWRVVDGAHNADSFAKMFVSLRRHFPYERLILVMASLADKDLAGIVREVALAATPAEGLPFGPARLARIVVTTAPTPRTLEPATLAGDLRTAAPWLTVDEEPDRVAALAQGVSLAGPRDLVCVAGTLYLAGVALRWFAGQSDVIPGAIEIDGVDHE